MPPLMTWVSADSGSTGSRRVIAAWNSCWALVTLVPYSSSRRTTELPALDVDVVPSSPATTPAACSMTSVTCCSTTSGDAPG